MIGAKDPAGFELCGATQESCRFVRAQLAGGGKLLLSDAAAATRVRFCWADSPLCNLYDSTGLPVGPFEIASESINGDIPHFLAKGDAPRVVRQRAKDRLGCVPFC